MKQVLLATVTLAGLSACAAPPPASPAGKTIGLPNPAAVYCQKLGGQLVPQKGADGSAQTFCHLPDGTQIEQWALYRRDHPRP